MTIENAALLLRRCPFCGGEPDISTRTNECLWSHDQVEWTEIGCHECDISYSLPTSALADICESWNRRPPATSQKVDLSAAMDITDRREAQDFIWNYVDVLRASNNGMTTEDAIKLAKNNIGYFAGYYGHDTRLRVEDIFDCTHPYLPAAKNKQLSTTEILDLGLKMGRELIQKNEPNEINDA